MEVTVLNRQRSRSVPRSELEAFASRLAREAPGARSGGFSVCLVSDRRMREYNAAYRGIRRPTDVLAFPDDEEYGSYLGDIVVSVESAGRQAEEAGHSLLRELEILVLHGYLHLLGHDHETDDGQMMRLQRRLVREHCHGH